MEGRAGEKMVEDVKVLRERIEVENDEEEGRSVFVRKRFVEIM